MKSSIQDLDSLNRAIQELEQRKVSLENQLANQGDHLQQHFLSMAVKSARQQLHIDKDSLNGIAGLFNKEKLKESLSGVVYSVSDIATQGIESLLGRWKKRKDTPPGS